MEFEILSLHDDALSYEKHFPGLPHLTFRPISLFSLQFRQQ